MDMETQKSKRTTRPNSEEEEFVLTQSKKLRVRVSGQEDQSQSVQGLGVGLGGSLVDYSSDDESDGKEDPEDSGDASSMTIQDSESDSDGEKQQEDKQQEQEGKEELTLPRSRRRFCFSSIHDLESSQSDSDGEEQEEEEEDKEELTLPRSRDPTSKQDLESSQSDSDGEEQEEEEEDKEQEEKGRTTPTLFTSSDSSSEEVSSGEESVVLDEGDELVKKFEQMEDNVQKDVLAKLREVRLRRAASLGNRRSCPLGCRPGQTYANVYNHMARVHERTYSSVSPSPGKGSPSQAASQALPSPPSYRASRPPLSSRASRSPLPFPSSGSTPSQAANTQSQASPSPPSYRASRPPLSSRASRSPLPSPSSGSTPSQAANTQSQASPSSPSYRASRPPLSSRASRSPLPSPSSGSTPPSRASPPPSQASPPPSQALKKDLFSSPASATCMTHQHSFSSLSTSFVSPAKDIAHSTPRVAAELGGFNGAYQTELFKDFEQYVRDTGRALPLSNHPKEVVQVVSKYLYFGNEGKNIATTEEVPWNLLVQQQLINKWVSRYQAIGCSAGSLYNKLDYLSRAARYASTMHSVKMSNEYVAFIKGRLTEFGHKKKSESRASKDEERDRPVLDLKKVYKKILVGEQVMKIFNDVLHEAKSSDECLPRSRYLLAMRLALAHAFIGIVSRPSGVTNIKLQDALTPSHGNWDDDKPVILLNRVHKTSSSHGSLRVCLEGTSKKIIRQFIESIRPKAPCKPKGDYLFFNSEGGPIDSSNFSKGLEAVQKVSGYTGVRATALRKAVVTYLAKDPDIDRRGLARTLGHTEHTATEYYNMESPNVSVLKTAASIKNAMEPSDEK